MEVEKIRYIQIGIALGTLLEIHLNFVNFAPRIIIYKLQKFEICS